MEMIVKNNGALIAIVFIGFIELMTACKTSVVNGQNDTNATSNRNIIQSEYPRNNGNPEPNLAKTRNQPEAKTVKLKEKIKKENLTKSGYLKLSKTLGWDGFCRLDSEINDEVEAVNAPFYKIGEDKYLLEVGCNQAGGYLTECLFYYIDEANLTAKLLSFEIIEKNDINVPLRRYISSHPIGETYFDEKTKMLFIRHRYSGAGQCGWEAAYQIKTAKAVLAAMRAEWNCTPGTDYDNWQKLNLKELRRNAGKQ